MDRNTKKIYDTMRNLFSLVQKLDEEFIKKLNEIILSNLSNQEFSMDDIAESLNMSRSIL